MYKLLIALCIAVVLVINVIGEITGLDYKPYLVPNSERLQAELIQMATPIAKVAKYRKPLKIEIYSSLVPNAFALSDGTILVTSGMLIQEDNANLIFAVLAHEIAHLAKKHHEKYLNNSNKLWNELARNKIAEEDQVLQRLLESNRYQQSQELEADKLAIQYLKRLKRSTYTYVDMLLRMQKLEDFFEVESAEIDQYDEIISTHPALSKRIKLLNKFAHKSGVQIDNAAYLNSLMNSPIYRSNRLSLQKGRQIIFANIPLEIVLNGNAKLLSLTIDTALIQKNKTQYNLRVSSGYGGATEAIDSLMKEELFSYKLQQTFKGKNAVGFKAISKISPSKCIAGYVIQKNSYSLRIWQGGETSCGLPPQMDLIEVEEKSMEWVSSQFLLKLHYVNEFDGPLPSNAEITSVQDFDQWLNLTNANRLKKRLY